MLILRLLNLLLLLLLWLLLLCAMNKGTIASAVVRVLALEARHGLSVQLGLQTAAHVEDVTIFLAVAAEEVCVCRIAKEHVVSTCGVRLRAQASRLTQVCRIARTSRAVALT